MLRLLLDHHISPEVVTAVRRLQAGIRVEHVQQRHWQALQDPELLRQARANQLTLVTYDQASLADFLRQFAVDQEDHAGVIFVDTKTIRPSDIGGLARALARLCSREKDATWLNRIYYLARG
jgi:predicted nuclease of predicted toxin-antitoxin system